MPNRHLLLLVFSWLSCIALAFGAPAADEYSEGQKVKKVVKLTTENFRTAINDPANPIWFLKFYAYW